jgi:hypothetical protein
MGVEVDYGKLSRKLKSLKRRMAPYGPEGYLVLVAGIHQHLQAQAAGYFESEGASSPSGRWAPLRPRTVEVRARLRLPGIGGEHPINRRTGDLLDMMTKEQPEIVTMGGDLALIYPGDRAINQGDRPVKVAQAQSGYHGGTARPVIQFGADNLAKVVTMANRFYSEAVA